MADFVPPLPVEDASRPPLPMDESDWGQQSLPLVFNSGLNELDFSADDLPDGMLATKRRRTNNFGGSSDGRLNDNKFLMPSSIRKTDSALSLDTDAGLSSVASFDTFDKSMDGEDGELDDDDERDAFNPGHDFEIIDDAESEGEADGSRQVNGDDDSDDSVDENEIDALLDQGVGSKKTRVAEDGSREDGVAFVEREKIVLKDRSLDPFDILPEGWVTVTHTSGMHIYLHRQSRVCTLARPYFLGPGSVRKHEIPLSAIPCLQYQKLLEREAELEREKEDAAVADVGNAEDDVDGSKPASGSVLPPKVKVETVNDFVRKSLSAAELREYCAKRFEFKTITVRRYRTWKERRNHSNLQKKMDRPQLPPETKLITCPLPMDKESEKQKRMREFWMNPSKKSDICILHEYAQHVLRTQPQYVFQELVNAKTPFSAVVTIGDVEYGRGYGHSKKVAKSEAAKATLAILIPELKKLREDSDAIKKEEVQTLAFFDDVKIEDPRVPELCLKAGQPTPFAVLHECLKRNFGMGDTEIQMDMKVLKNRKNEFTMKVGKQEAKVMCRNKREGKQLASQTILKMLHPHITCWGSLLRLYCQTHEVQEKKVEEQSVLELQQKLHSSQPNKPILEKLRSEMQKLQEKREQLRSNVKGTLQMAGEGLSYSSALGGIDI